MSLTHAYILKKYEILHKYILLIQMWKVPKETQEKKWVLVINCTSNCTSLHVTHMNVQPRQNMLICRLHGCYLSRISTYTFAFFKLSVGCRSSCCFLYINKVGRRSTDNTRVPRYWWRNRWSMGQYIRSRIHWV